MVALLYVFLSLGTAAKIEDNEFAEFEEDDSFEDVLKEPESHQQEEPASQTVSNDDTAEEDADFSDIITSEEDEEEEEEEEAEVEVEEEEDVDGFIVEDDDKTLKNSRPEDIKLAQSDVPVSRGIHDYWTEITIVLGMVVYLLNYLFGKMKNWQIAKEWYTTNKELLTKNFEVVGKGDEEIPLVKESDAAFSLWATGRQNCNGMAVVIKTQRRNDLLSLTLNVITPSTDSVTLSFHLGSTDMESFVLAVAKKKAASKMVKELNDIINFCPTPRRGENYGLPSSFLVLSEGSEATSAVINQSFVEVLKKFEPFIESVHVTDQYTGIKEDYAESEAVEVPDPTAMLFCTFTGTNMKAHEALTGFALQLLDRVSRVKLSKEAKEKAVKARSKVAQSVMKLSHAQRQEAAQAKKEAKKRQDRDKLMDLEPDKARLSLIHI